MTAVLLNPEVTFLLDILPTLDLTPLLSLSMIPPKIPPVSLVILS
jgi:hypothetical protein